MVEPVDRLRTKFSRGIRQFDLSALRSLFLSLMKAGALIAFGKLTMFTLHLLLARKMGAEVYGQFNLVWTVATIAALVLSFGVPTAVMRFLARYRAAANKQEEKGIVLFGLTIGVGTAFITLISGLSIIWLGSFEKHTTELILLSTLLTMPLIFSLIRAGLVRAFDQTAMALLPKEVAFPLFSILLLLTVRLENKVEAISGIILVLMIVEAVALAHFLGRFVRPYKAVTALIRTKEWIKVSLSLVFSRLMFYGINRIDLLVLGVYATAADLGAYAVAINIALIAQLVVHIITIVLAPRFSATFATGDQSETAKVLKEGIAMAAVGGTIVCSILVIFAEPIVRLFGDEFEQAVPLVRILALGQFLNTLTGPVASCLNMTAHERLVAVISLVSTLVTTVVLVLIVPIYNVVGAAWVTSGALIMFNGALFFYCYKLFLRKQPDYYRSGRR